MSSSETPPSASPETKDAHQVEAALQLLSQRDVAGAEELLRDVVSRAPSDYVRSHEKDNIRLVKFWSQEEFVHEATRSQGQGGTQLLWLRCAYPRAFFYLGFARMAQKDAEGAIRWLEEGMKLEPHPMFRLELGKAYSSLKQYERALELYEGVATMGPELMATYRAVALRGKGFQLIELGQLDASEKCFHDSLMLEPGNTIAIRELQYIEHLRQGGRTGGMQTVTTGFPQGLQCTVCGGDVDKGRSLNYEGRVVWLCAACVARATASGKPAEAPPASAKKWWQFWRS